MDRVHLTTTTLGVSRFGSDGPTSTGRPCAVYLQPPPAVACTRSLDCVQSTDRHGRPTVRRLIGVYDADSSVRGELSYFIGARLGRAHCALCDITHGLVRERAAWKSYRESLPVPFDAYHRDDQADNVRAAHEDRAPVVLAATDNGFVVLLGPDALATCAGSVEQLSYAVDAAVTRARLTWPT